jgi:hypothetical protein
MVKNTQGGNKSKGFARKNIVKKDSTLRIAQEEDEIYAQAVKVMGGSIASVIDLKGNTMKAHIRGKFRGRGKKDNFIGPGTWLLVGLHSWEGETKSNEMRNCDILEVYTETDKIRLKNSLTNVNWSKFISNDTKSINCGMDGKEEEDLGFVFGDDTTEEYEKIIALTENKSKEHKLKIIDENEAEISIEDL